MLHGSLVGLRAREEADVAILHRELYEDAATRSRADTRPWRPVPVASSPYAVSTTADDADFFSVVELATGTLAGEAVLWGIDAHNRTSHVGLSLRPECRGRGLGEDVLRVLCEYGFTIRGLHRLQVEMVSDNDPMARTATRVGFRAERRLRQSLWVSGEFCDEVIMGLLVDEWRSR